MRLFDDGECTRLVGIYGILCVKTTVHRYRTVGAYGWWVHTLHVTKAVTISPRPV